MIQIGQKKYSKPLLVFALESEAGREFEAFDKIFVGVGKINATYHLLKGIEKYQPDLIINLGTAGSTVFDRGSVICCTEFIQRDMEVTALGFQKFETPFSDDPVVLKYGIEVPCLPKGICGSGDQFETEHQNHKYNVIEMEAFALATVAKNEKIPFLCLKYISDGADGSAVQDWNLEVKKAAGKMKETLIQNQPQ